MVHRKLCTVKIPLPGWLIDFKLISISKFYTAVPKNWRIVIKRSRHCLSWRFCVQNSIFCQHRQGSSIFSSVPFMACKNNPHFFGDTPYSRSNVTVDVVLLRTLSTSVILHRRCAMSVTIKQDPGGREGPGLPAAWNFPHDDLKDLQLSWFNIIVLEQTGKNGGFIRNILSPLD